MPTGTQQTLEGLMCTLCDEVIRIPADWREGWCRNCECYLTTCSSCEDEFIDSSEASGEILRRALHNRIGYRMMFGAEDSGEYVCSECVYSCDHCDNMYQYENSLIECCRRSDMIHDYSYTPVYRYYSVPEGSTEVHSTWREAPDTLFMGIELEIARIYNGVNGFFENCTTEAESFVFFKEDGSIGADGAELVTMPATIEAFKEIFPFDALDVARANGARSYRYASCGFHIHVSRRAFKPSHMWKFVRFQLKNPYLCQRVAQRDESSYASWYFDETEKRSLPEYVKGTKANGRRYLAINFQNSATVELRYFKGNLLRSAIMKNVEFVQSIYDYTKHMSIRDIMAGAMDEHQYHLWLSKSDKYPNLVNFLNNNENERGD